MDCKVDHNLIILFNIHGKTHERETGILLCIIRFINFWGVGWGYVHSMVELRSRKSQLGILKTVEFVNERRPTTF
jgi:hypothetical protein